MDTPLATTSDLDSLDDHDKIAQEMKKLQDELMKLCEMGQHDEAEKKAHKELRPLHEKWLKTLYQSFTNFRNHPNFYKPK